MPFAGYKNFKTCVKKNAGKRKPKAYCGAIKHRVEGKGKSSARNKKKR